MGYRTLLAGLGSAAVALGVVIVATNAAGGRSKPRRLTFTIV